jgi:tRNA-dihydrouridine synthase
MVEHAKLFEKVFQPIDRSEFKSLRNGSKIQSESTEAKTQSKHNSQSRSKFPKSKANKKLGLKNFDVMKKHFKAYVSGWDGAKELRVELMKCGNAKELTVAVKKYLSTLS